MKPKIRASRALAAYTAARSLRLISKIVLAILLIVTMLVTLLAVSFSSYWLWVLPVVFFVVSILFLVRLLIKSVIKSVYPDPLSQSQRKALSGITDKAVRLAEARSTPLFMIALITLKDVVFNRDITHVKKIFSDSGTFVDDLTKLEKEFKDR